MRTDAGLFAALDGATVDKMLGVLNDGMARDPLYNDRMDDLQKIGLTKEQAHDAIDWFYDFYIGAKNPALMTAMLRSLDVDDRTKESMIYAFQKVEKIRNWPRAGHCAEPAASKKDPNADEYEKFVYRHGEDPAFRGKYVAFVHGEYQKCGTSEDALIQEMLEKFPGTDMHVGPVAKRRPVEIIDTPELA